MERAKLLERLQKLLAMSKDSSSPEEAAIADRRLKALMAKHQITLDEITDTKSSGSDRSHSSAESSKSRARSPRRKRTKPSVAKRKRKFKYVRDKKSTAPLTVTVFGIVVALSLWFAYTKVDRTRFIDANVLTRSSDVESRFQVPTLQSKLERSSIVEGELVILHIIGSAVSVPSTSSLHQNFVVLDSQLKRGVDPKSFHLRMRLQPRQSGLLFVPSFRVDGVQTDSIALDVLPRN